MLSIQVKLLLLVLAAGAGRRPRWPKGIWANVEVTCPATLQAVPSASFPVLDALSPRSDEEGFEAVPSSSPSFERIVAESARSVALERLP